MYSTSSVYFAVYVIFLLLEHKTFNAKLVAITPNEQSLKTSQDIFNQITNDINSYMKIKTGVSLLTAGLSFAVLALFGISYAQF